MGSSPSILGGYIFMKVMSYEKFATLQAENLRKKRKRIGVSILNAEEVIFGTKNSIALFERNENRTSFRTDYLDYIYRIVLDAADYSGKLPKEIFENLEFRD